MRFESIKNIERANFHINFPNTIVQKKPHPNEKKKTTENVSNFKHSYMKKNR